MERLVGTVSRGIRAPIIREGDDISKIVVDSVLSAAESSGFQIHDQDIIAVTEAVVARAQGNYATVQQIAQDIKSKFGGETMANKRKRPEKRLEIFILMRYMQVLYKERFRLRRLLAM